MTIEIPNELEPILKAEAGKAGVDPTTYTHQLLRKSLERNRALAPCLPEEETQLLKAIASGPSTEEMERYRQLIRKRQQGEITQHDLRLLNEMTRRMESLQVQRLEDLTRLARVRGVDVGTLMHQLGIRPADVL